MLIKAEHACLPVVDLQERLIPAISGHERMIARRGLLMRVADRLAAPMLVCEGSAPPIGDEETAARAPAWETK